jgi:ankyrin repeat protein
VKQGDFAAVRRLLTENPALLNAKDERFGATSLHWAALRGHQAIVALLIAQGADGAAKNNDGETALQVADRAKREEVARLLRSAAPAGAAPGDIFEAVKSGDVEGTRRLLEQNPALLNQPDASFGATPLHWAALRGHEEVVRLLVASGADISAKNKDGEMPRQVAERGKRAGVVQLLRQSADSADAIVDAVRAGDLARVQSALAADAGALNRKDTRFGATPLHWAALKGNVEIVKFLVAKGADQNATNRDGETPLRVAERAKRSEVIALLKTGRGGSSSPEGS